MKPPLCLFGLGSLTKTSERDLGSRDGTKNDRDNERGKDRGWKH